jgi:hypothetical protein
MTCEEFVHLEKENILTSSNELKIAGHKWRNKFEQDQQVRNNRRFGLKLRPLPFSLAYGVIQICEQKVIFELTKKKN